MKDTSNRKILDGKLTLVNNQLDVQFFMYVYFYSLHVSTCFGQLGAHHQENYCISTTPVFCHSL